MARRLCQWCHQPITAKADVEGPVFHRVCRQDYKQMVAGIDESLMKKYNIKEKPKREQKSRPYA